MQDASLPSWLKRDDEQENEQRSTRRRKGPGSSQDQEGLDAADTWFRKLREQQGDHTQDQGSTGPGSPHVQVGTKTIHAILNTEVQKKPEQQELRNRLMNW